MANFLLIRQPTKILQFQPNKSKFCNDAIIRHNIFQLLKYELLIVQYQFEGWINIRGYSCSFPFWFQTFDSTIVILGVSSTLEVSKIVYDTRFDVKSFIWIT